MPILILLLAACIPLGAGSFPTVEPVESPRPLTPTVVPQPDCTAGTTLDFSDYASWAKVNARPIQGHEVWVDIYVDDLAKEIYQSASGAVFPVCARIVKTHLAGPDSDMVTAVTVMVKMPQGYDPDHNDWWWGMYDRDGKVAEMSGKVEICITCHQPAAAADYVFSQAVLAAAQK